MKIQITNSVDTTIGLAISNSVSTLQYSTNTFDALGNLQVEMRTWVSEAAQALSSSNIYLKKDGNYIGIFSIHLTQEEIDGNNLPLTIYTKTKDYLVATYGWTVNVI